mmetsp:Transcript_78750/g.163804  ORF Transcript_78750/g.163804 Transcript_78750/m.163804 type:complete len:505 (-) Transcript_78750:26-1540(-)
MATSEKSTEHVRGVAGPAAGPAQAGQVRRGVIGPAPRPKAGIMQQSIAFTEVHTSAPKKVPSTNKKDPDAADTVAVANCRRGELPPKGWSSKWNEATRLEGLKAAIETAQMHVVYAMRPQSEVFQDSVGAPVLDQENLDKLLRLHVSGKSKVPKQRCQEAVDWLLSVGASLEGLASDEDFATRAAAAATLASAGQGGERAIPLLKSQDWRCRATAAEALEKIGRPASQHSEAVAALLGDPEAVVRMAAAAALPKLGHEAIPFVAPFLSSDKARSREAAAGVLAQFGAAAAPHAGALAELLEDSDWQVPTAASNALKKIGPAAAPFCAEVLGRCDPAARTNIVQALTRMGGREVACAVGPLLASQEPGVRRHVVDCLGALELAAVEGQLETVKRLAAEDPDKDVKKHAREALWRLGVRGLVPEDLGSGDALPEGIARAAAGEGSSRAQDTGGDGKGKGKGKGKVGRKGKDKDREKERGQRSDRGCDDRRQRSRNRSRSRSRHHRR